MCNRFTISTAPSELAEWFEAEVSPEYEGEEHAAPAEVFPYGTSPGLLLNQQQVREIRPLQFSITPVWSKEQKVKYQTNNARVEEIETKKTFSGSFERQRCIVPITRFREACYWGEPAGKEVEFERADGELLLAAGIYSIWQGKTTMALLMRPAAEQVMQAGHHRQPLFIRREGVEPWIGGGQRPPQQCKQLLKQYVHEPMLCYKVAREMAPTWKSRQHAHVAQREEQLEAIARTGPLGY